VFRFEFRVFLFRGDNIFFTVVKVEEERRQKQPLEVGAAAL
jgi:hypothetical protein